MRLCRILFAILSDVVASENILLNPCVFLLAEYDY